MGEGLVSPGARSNMPPPRALTSIIWSDDPDHTPAFIPWLDRAPRPDARLAGVLVYLFEDYSRKAAWASNVR